MLDKIIITAYILSPYANPCFENYPKNRHCHDPGIEILLLYNQLITLGFEPTFLLANNYSHMISLVETGEADITGMMEAIDHKSATVSYAHPGFEDKYIFIGYLNKENYVIPNILFSNCHWSVWSIFFSIFIIVISPNLIQNWKFLDIFVIMAKYAEFVFCSWGFSFGLFLSIYSGYMAVTLVTDPIVIKPFKSFEQLSKIIESKNCSIVVGENTYSLIFDDNFTQYKKEVVTFFQFALHRGIVKKVTDDDDHKSLAEALKFEKCAYGVALKSQLPMIQANYDGFDVIDLDDIPVLQFAYIYRNSFPQGNLLKLINAGNIVGLYNYHLHEAAERVKQKRSIKLNRDFSNQMEMKHRPLKLDQLDSVFFLLIASSVIGLALLFINWVTFCRNRDQYTIT